MQEQIEITPALAEALAEGLAENLADLKTLKVVPNRREMRKTGSRWGLYRMPRTQAKRTGTPAWFAQAHAAMLRSTEGSTDA